jgi:DNA-binding NarL/FixJ family response regulator
MASVWIIEDNPLFRKGTQRALEAPPHQHQVRSFENCEDAIAALRNAACPEVILLDVGLPGMDGITGIAHLKSQAPGTSILILTVFTDDDKIFRAICAGASGYLLKSEPMGELLTAVQQALAGGSPMNPRIAGRVLSMFAKLAPPQKDYDLNERERSVLKCMVEGMSRKQIVEATQLNPHTADYVTRSIYRKLHVHCATAAVSLAVRERLLEERRTTPYEPS